jgi:hypothetical protein
MYRPEEQPFGRTWEEWTSKWWQWFFSIPIENHPAFDETGDKGYANLFDSDVLFLAGTTGGYAERTINIPAGKAVLLPVINIATSYSENPNLKTEKEMASFVNAHMKNIAKKEASIDGENARISEKHRVKSRTFEFSFPLNNIYGVKEGPTRGTGDGYWIFLRPLPPGIHLITTSGECMSGRIQIGVKIKLIVEK